MRRASVSILALICLVSSTVVVGAESDWETFEFESYNREFVNIRANAEWENDGPIKIKARSPAHRLTIHDHTVDLQARGDGSHRARIRVHFAGEGDLVATLSVAGADTTLDDHVIAPDQEVEVDSVVRFSRVDEGYEVETIEMPETVSVEIESELGKKMVSICQSALSFLGVNCDGIDSMFSTATIPLPRPGGTYFISDDKLSRAERKRLKRYLAKSTG